jgi:hypothetical protein
MLDVLEFEDVVWTKAGFAVEHETRAGATFFVGEPGI